MEVERVKLGFVAPINIITTVATLPWFSILPSKGGVRIWTRESQDLISLLLPPPAAEVMPGVVWGRPDELLTPAYWRAQAWFASSDDPGTGSHSIGNTLREEVAVCLLIRHGVPAEIGLAAFERLRRNGFLADWAAPREVEIRKALSFPLKVGQRRVRYRYPKQVSVRLTEALTTLARSDPPTNNPLAFRAFFLQLPGFGPKTASWLTRNWLGSDAVAILDVHVHRAGLMAGVFSRRHVIARDYEEMELRFIQFSRAVGVRPSVLDAIIWRDMRRLGQFGRELVDRRLRRRNPKS